MAQRRHPLEKLLGHHFAAPDLLAEALTHRSVLGGHGKPGISANERLEFLGDRVLGLVIAETLLKAFPGENEGQLARRLAALVSTATLAQVAKVCDLAQHLRTAPGQKTSGNDSAVMADACEAVIGALFMDGGLKAARDFIGAQWGDLIQADPTPPKDAKTALQEWAQGRGLPLPVYTVEKSQGPAHAPSFTMTVAVEGHPPATGQGRTKRAATQAAAAALLEKLQ